MSRAPVRDTLQEKPTESTLNLKDPVWFREWFKVIVRQWAQHLTLRQLGMVIFIFDRTAAWGKEWELIRYSSFVTGITSKDGDKRYAAGICGCERSALTLTNELLDMGMIVKRRSREGNYWALNYEWTPENMSKIRRLSRNPQKAAGPNTQKPAGLNPQKAAGHNKGYAEDEEVTQKEQCPAGDDFFHSALVKARAKGQAAIERRKARKQNSLSLPDMMRLWSESCRSAPWAEYATPREYLTKRDTFALQSYAKRFAKAFPNEKFSEYLGWVIEKWPGLISDLFGWMTKAPPPETPSPLFLIKWAKEFEGTFLQRRAFEKRMEMTPEEREVARLVKSGMSEEQARRKARIKHVPGGREVKHAPTETVVIRSKPRRFADRRSSSDTVSLPSMGDQNPYEDE